MSWPCLTTWASVLSSSSCKAEFETLAHSECDLQSSSNATWTTSDQFVVKCDSRTNTNHHCSRIFIWRNNSNHCRRGQVRMMTWRWQAFWGTTLRLFLWNFELTIYYSSNLHISLLCPVWVKSFEPLNILNFEQLTRRQFFKVYRHERKYLKET